MTNNSPWQMLLLLVLSVLTTSIATEIIQRLLLLVLLERIVHALCQVLAQGRGQIGKARRSHALPINVLRRCREGSADVTGVGRQLRGTEQCSAAALLAQTTAIVLADSRTDRRCSLLASVGKSLQPDTTARTRSGDVSSIATNTYCAASNSIAISTTITALKEHAAGQIEAVGTVALVGGGAESWGWWGRRRPVQAAHGGAQRQALIEP